MTTSLDTSPARVATPGPEEQWRANLRGKSVSATLVGARADDWYTGVKPGSTCPGWDDGKLRSLPLPNIATADRATALDYFNNSWTLTEVLFAALQGEEPFYCPPSHRLRHPLIFYLAHPAVLYINKLRVAGVLTDGLDAHMESVMETGVDEMSWDDLSKNDAAWPSVAEVVAYRRKAYAVVRDVIATHPAMDGCHQLAASPTWALFMGFEHERIHLETSSVLIRELPLRLLRRPAAWPEAHPSALAGVAREAPREGMHYPANPVVVVPAGRVSLGKPTSWPSFGWDNEYGSRQFSLPSFGVSRFAVSNGQFLAFIRGGGYSTPRFWTAEGWRWRTFRNAKWPSFWVPDGPAGLHAYTLRLTFEAVPMPWALPAVVNVHEARAYAAWASAAQAPGAPPLRLLTEAEHARLRALDDAPDVDAEDSVMRLSGAAARGIVNLQLAWGSENAVDAMPAGRSGLSGVSGSVWQWCEDTAAALPGFAVHPFYEDFSTPCFDGRHHIIVGGSWASTGDLASRFARYHFRPHFHQHAGFRLVSSAEPAQLTSHDAPPPYSHGWVPPRAPSASPVADALAVSRALLRVAPSSAGAPPRDADEAAARHGAAVAAALAEGARALGHSLVDLLRAAATAAQPGSEVAATVAAALAELEQGTPKAA